MGPSATSFGLAWEKCGPRSDSAASDRDVGAQWVGSMCVGCRSPVAYDGLCAGSSCSARKIACDGRPIEIHDS